MYDRSGKRLGTVYLAYVPELGRVLPGSLENFGVSRAAPRMQRTLLELGFLPVAYIPALTFHEVERLDAVRMVCLQVEPKFEYDLIPEVATLAEVVTSSFIERYVLPQVTAVASKISLFRGLNHEQVQRLAGLCRQSIYPAGSVIFRRHQPSERLVTVLSGQVLIQPGPDKSSIVQLGPYASLGEMSLVSGNPHSACATAATNVVTAEISHIELQQLVRRRPDIGVVLYRNLAAGLGEKLCAVDAQLLAYKTMPNRT